MADHNHSPEVVPHTLINGHTEFPMSLEDNEIHLVTATYPIRDFVAHVVSQPCRDDDEDLTHAKRCRIISHPLDPDSENAMADHRVQIMLTTDEYLADFLKTRVLFWNCTSTCLFNYRGEIASLCLTDAFDVAVTLGGADEDENTLSFWTDMGLTRSTLSNFGGHGPSVTVKWDASVVNVVATESLVGAPDQNRVLRVEVERLHFPETIRRTFTFGVIETGNLSPPPLQTSSSEDDD